MEKRLLDLENWDIAEAIFRFCAQDEEKKRYFEHCTYEDLSLAEYVDRYRYSDFEKWYLKTYG